MQSQVGLWFYFFILYCGVGIAGRGGVRVLYMGLWFGVKVYFRCLYGVCVSLCWVIIVICG